MEMICKNCGGKFDIDEIVCPYCGFENIEQALDEQKDYIDDYKRKTKELKKKPKKIVRFSRKVILTIFGGILALFILVLVIASIVRTISGDDTDLGKQKEELRILEEYYSHKDYQKLYDYLDDVENKHSDSYEKYYIAYRMYDDYLFVEEQAVDCANLYIEYQVDNDGENLVYSVYLCCENLNKIKELRDNGYVYGEDEVAEDFDRKFKAVLSDHLKMTDEEIEEAINIYEGNSDAYKGICKELAKRLSSGGNK